MSGAPRLMSGSSSEDVIRQELIADLRKHRVSWPLKMADIFRLPSIVGPIKLTKQGLEIKGQLIPISNLCVDQLPTPIMITQRGIDVNDQVVVPMAQLKTRMISSQRSNP